MVYNCKELPPTRHALHFYFSAPVSGPLLLSSGSCTFPLAAANRADDASSPAWSSVTASMPPRRRSPEALKLLLPPALPAHRAPGSLALRVVDFCGARGGRSPDDASSVPLPGPLPPRCRRRRRFSWRNAASAASILFLGRRRRRCLSILRRRSSSQPCTRDHGQPSSLGTTHDTFSSK